MTRLRPRFIPLTEGHETGPTLVVVHDLDGRTEPFRRLADLLDERRIIAIESPLWAGRPCPGSRDLLALAESYADSITREIGTSLQLLGVSFGGLLAFEIAAALERRGDAHPGLVVVDIGPASLGGTQADFTKAPVLPELWQPLAPVATRAQHRRSFYAQLILEQPPRISVRYLAGRARLVSPVDRVTVAHDLRRFGVVRVARRPWFVRNEHLEALRHYRVSSIQGSLDVLRTTQGSTADRQEMGWGPFVRGDVRVTDVDAHHLRVLDAPGVDELAETLRSLALPRILPSGDHPAPEHPEKP